MTQPTPRFLQLTTAHRRAERSEQQIVYLTAVTGTYVRVAMLLETVHQPVPEKHEPPLTD